MKKLFCFLFTLASIISASAQNLPRIHVEGNNFADENGKTVIFRGLCFSDPVKLLLENKWGVDHFNEATIQQKDLGSCTWDDWRSINEQIIDTIRTYDTDKVCLCAGFDWAYDLRGIKAKPIRRPNIAYVSHPYPMKREQP